MRPPAEKPAGTRGHFLSPVFILPFIFVSGDNPGSWPDILGAVGFQSAVSVVPAGAADGWQKRLEGGAYLILEGESEAATAFGFRAGGERVSVQSLEDLRRPALRIIWEEALELPRFDLPAQAHVFARERRTGAPLMAGFRHGAGAVLWLAAPPGRQGYERFPYLLHALLDLGLEPPFQSRRLWAFFDSSYRLRADPDYLARRWRKSGIAALHVAAWHFYDPDAERDAYLRELIRACHRNAILVYAWLELPHVSERFWNEHPHWREKTAMLQDAHLDWRKLMNLSNRECFRAAAAGVRRLVEAFDWDGVNLAELYFESLEGAASPSRFTPMNDDVRREFAQAHGFDPLELFPRGGATASAGRMRLFLDFRAALAARMQEEWLGELDALRKGSPHLDLVLTHVDDRFDTGMRDAIGADAARLLPLLARRDFLFLIEDPATVWHLGPRRYPEIARRYGPLAPRADKLGIDINVVERYQDVYPTKKQTGTELLQLVRLASESFPRVALYFENSILPPDLALLPAAAAAVTGVERIGRKLAVESRYGTGMSWTGPALVNGKPWPAGDGALVWLPAGRQVVEAAAGEPAARLLDFNGDLAGAAALPDGLEIAYTSAGRALAVLDRLPVSLELDGTPAPLEIVASRGSRYVLRLPRGQHLVRIRTQ